MARPSRSAEQITSALQPDLAEHGLFILGWLVMDIPPFAGRAAVVIGNHADHSGPGDGSPHHPMWEAFRNSGEFGDGAANPLDRWTKRVAGAIAGRAGAVALYPFGETVWPFQRWAAAATGMRASPLGLLIHPEHGLWIALRAVLVFDGPVSLPARAEKMIHPCDDCLAKPCLSACPVNAFSDDGFDVAGCRRHLSGGGEPRCMVLGCRARAACPVGTPYGEEQIRFHMQAFAG